MKKEVHTLNGVEYIRAKAGKPDCCTGCVCKDSDIWCSHLPSCKSDGIWIEHQVASAISKETSETTTVRTFKEVLYFCLLDGEYREYYDIPEESECTREQWKLYYKNRGDVISYRGTALYGQSQERLEWFLGQKPPHILLTLDLRTFEVLGKNPHNGLSFTVSARVCGFGVQVEFSEPFHHRCCRFVAISDRPFTPEGVIAEVKAYCDKHLLLPPGRYRDIQIEKQWQKRHFIERYRNYRAEVALENEEQHRDMLTRYAHARFISDEQACLRLSAEGVFDALNCHDEEQLRMAEEFAEGHNREISVDGFIHKDDVVVAYNEGADTFEVYCLDRNDEVVSSKNDVHLGELVGAVDGLVEKEP